MRKYKNEFNFLGLRLEVVPKPADVYTLGFIWADGHVSKTTNRITICNAVNDMRELLPIFNSVGPWNKYYSKSKNPKWQDKISIDASSKNLKDFLELNDYTSKSIKSADKILSKIPSSLKKYWFRGLFDGDGCWYVNYTQALYQVTVTGPYEQDWSFVENLFQELNIPYAIKLRSTQNGSRSTIRISGKQNFLKLGKYIYDEYDGVGLKRKYEKFQSILNMPNRSETKSHHYEATNIFTGEVRFYRSLADAIAAGYSRQRIRLCAIGKITSHKNCTWRRFRSIPSEYNE